MRNLDPNLIFETRTISGVVKELDNVTARLISIFFGGFLRSEMACDDWRKANTAFIFRKGTNSDSEHYRLGNLTLFCRKITESS